MAQGNLVDNGVNMRSREAREAREAERKTLLAMEALIRERLREFDEDVLGEETNGISEPEAEMGKVVEEDVDMSG